MLSFGRGLLLQLLKVIILLSFISAVIIVVRVAFYGDDIKSVPFQIQLSGNDIKALGLISLEPVDR